MDNSFSPIVITSKAADNHLNDIKSQHADLLQGMQSQAEKIILFNQQKQAQRVVDQQRSDTLAKESAESDRKTKELEIKQAALML